LEAVKKLREDLKPVEGRKTTDLSKADDVLVKNFTSKWAETKKLFS